MGPHKRGTKHAPSGELHPNAKLDWDKVRYCRENPDKLEPLQLAKKFGVTHSTIHAVLRGETWKEK